MRRDGNDVAVTEAPVTIATSVGRVTLSVPADDTFPGALRLLVGGIGSRSQLSWEQVDELQLAVEALVARRTVAGETLLMEAELGERAVTIALGPFLDEGDDGERRMLERLVRDVAVMHREASGEWVMLDVGAGDGAEPTA